MTYETDDDDGALFARPERPPGPVLRAMGATLAAWQETGHLTAPGDAVIVESLFALADAADIAPADKRSRAVVLLMRAVAEHRPPITERDATDDFLAGVAAATEVRNRA